MVDLSISLSICDTYVINIIINICDTLLIVVFIIIMVNKSSMQAATQINQENREEEKCDTS